MEELQHEELLNTCSNKILSLALPHTFRPDDNGLFPLSDINLSPDQLQFLASNLGLHLLTINTVSAPAPVGSENADSFPVSPSGVEDLTSIFRSPLLALLLPYPTAISQLDTTPVFSKNFDLNTRIVVNQGGTRSSKTYSLCQLLIIRLLAQQGSGMVLTIVRKTKPALKATVMRDFFEVLKSLGLYESANYSRSAMTYDLFGNLIEFVSMDDPQKKRGAKRDILWLNEANEFSLEDFRQLSLRTSGQIFLDYNPSDEFHWIYDEVLTREDCSFVQSTYLDNPFLPPEIISEIERLRRSDANYWKVFGLGERGTSQAAVYTHWQTISKLPDGGELIYGLDFGYNSPAALVKVILKDDEIFVEELLYKAGLTNSDLINYLNKHVPHAAYTIYADAAEPQRIEEIYRAGFNIKPANKDVRKGIDTIKARALSITTNSINLVKEARCYKYKQDLHGNILEDPVKYNDHALDALRYAVHTHLRKPKGNYANYIL